MSVRITSLTRADSGAYDESGDMAPDMLNGDTMPAGPGEAYRDWLKDEGYRPAGPEWRGWGLVLIHRETGEILSLTWQPD